MHIRFSDLGGGAIVFKEPYPDWSDYSVLILELFHAGEGWIELGLRIDDQHHSRQLTDRYNRHLTLAPGVNRFRIPLDEVLRGPAERELDLQRIERIVLFPVDPVGGFELFLAPIRLEAMQRVRVAR